MSTETVTSEKIIIHSGDKHNAEIRKALQNYLLQFVHSASIESASNLNLQLKIDDAVLLNLNGESCSGRNATPWQTKAATADAISQITEDCEVEVTLHLAGIYDNVNGINCFIILTTAPNDSVSPIHDRMPLMLAREQVRPWLTDAGAALELLVSRPPLLQRTSCDGQIGFEDLA